MVAFLVFVEERVFFVPQLLDEGGTGNWVKIKGPFDPAGCTVGVVGEGVERVVVFGFGSVLVVDF